MEMRNVMELDNGLAGVCGSRKSYNKKKSTNNSAEIRHVKCLTLLFHLIIKESFPGMGGMEKQVIIKYFFN